MILPLTDQELIERARELDLFSAQPGTSAVVRDLADRLEAANQRTPHVNVA